jgi:hypothetical protein
MKVLELFTRFNKVDLKLNFNTITLYASIHELPIELFTLFNSYVIQSLGIGTTIADINTRFSNLDSFLSAGKVQEALQERTNMHMGLFYGLEKINIEHICFACLVHSINGKEIEDYSEEGLRRTLKRLSKMGLTNQLVRVYLEEVKKNLIQN